jgi:hypothetical protein
MDGNMPVGGYVVAVQEGANTRGIKEYFKQFKKRFPNKGVVCYIRVPIASEGKALAFIYDSGTGEKKGLPKLEERKKSESERLLSLIPDETLALLLTTAFKKDDP